MAGWNASYKAGHCKVYQQANKRKTNSMQNQVTDGDTASKVKEAGESKASSASPDCGPARLLSIKRFGLSRDLVTVAQWKEYCTDVRKDLPKAPPWGWRDNHPVVNVTWMEIAGQSDRPNFCQWYSNKYGVSARLPSEEEWEYGLGGGSRQYELVLPAGLMASATWTSVGTKRFETAPVSRREFIHENPLGVRDMIGNGHQVCMLGIRIGQDALAKSAVKQVVNRAYSVAVHLIL